MLDEQQATKIFTAIESQIVGIVLGAWEDVYSSKLHFEKRGRANAVWDQIKFRAQNEWADSQFVTLNPINNGQTVDYWVAEDGKFRFKKGDTEGFTNNYPTETAQLFHDPNYELFENVTHLEVVYVLDKDEIEVDGIYVVHRLENSIDYMIPLGSSFNVVEMPSENQDNNSATSTQESEKRKSLVKRKSKDESEDTNHEQDKRGSE